MTEITNWENIPKVKHTEFTKQQSVTDAFKAASSQFKDVKVLKILSAIETSSTKNIHNPSPRKHGDLYNLVADVNLLRLAYNRLSKNKGALTPGVEQSTADSTSEEILEKISQALLTNQFKWSRTKRVWIPKPGRKEKRPLGIPDFSNKLVQESIKMVLQAIYEPEFKHYDTNKGFRPGCSCANSIDSIVNGAEGTDFVIEGDIEQAYPSMDHQILLKILKTKISDKKFINLIKTGLSAGLMEDGIEKDTIIGVTQGSIVSPLLFNIYMHEFDKYIVDELFPQYDTPIQPPEKVTANYETLGSRLDRAKAKILTIQKNKTELNLFLDDIINIVESNKEKYYFIRSTERYQKNISRYSTPPLPEALAAQRKYYINKKLGIGLGSGFYTPEEEKHIKAFNVRSTTNNRFKLWLKNQLQGKTEEVNKENIEILQTKISKTKSELLQTPYLVQETKRIRFFYSRYADDWVLFIRGTQTLAEEIKIQITEKLKSLLKFELSPHKTKVTNIRTDKVKYLGFEIFYQRNPLIFSRKINGYKFNQRHTALQIHPDTERLEKRFLTNHIMDSKGLPRELGFLTVLQDHEIIQKYNQKMLGIGNYYIRQISYPSRLNRWHYNLYYSCIKTLGTKHRLSTKSVILKYGFKDISIKHKNPHKIPATDMRICAKYQIDKETKYQVLLNYKEYMMTVKELKYNTPPPKTIDMLSLQKINYRTAFKLTTACAVCNSKDRLQNHHIKPIKHSGGKFQGFNGFDKLVASLGRKQLPLCHGCHQKVHKGQYDGMALNELYDIRLVTPESYLKLDGPPTTKPNPNLSKKEKDRPIIINEKAKTYFNEKLKHYIYKNEKT